MITDPTLMNQWFVGLDDVTLLGIDDTGVIPEVHIELMRTLVGYPTCGVVASVKDREVVRHTDLTLLGRRIVLAWHKRRLHCREITRPQGSWTEVDSAASSDHRSRVAMGDLSSGQVRPSGQ